MVMVLVVFILHWLLQVKVDFLAPKTFFLLAGALFQRSLRNPAHTMVLEIFHFRTFRRGETCGNEFLPPPQTGVHDPIT